MQQTHRNDEKGKIKYPMGIFVLDFISENFFILFRNRQKINNLIEDFHTYIICFLMPHSQSRYIPGELQNIRFTDFHFVPIRLPARERFSHGRFIALYF